MIRFQKRSLLAFTLVLGLAFLVSGCSSSSDKANKAKTKSGHPYVTDDIKAAIVIHPKMIYESETMKTLLETEMVEELVADQIKQANREFEFNVLEVKRVTVLVKALPSGPREDPTMAIVVEWNEASNLKQVADKLSRIDTHRGENWEVKKENGMTWYIPDNPPTEPIICLVNNKTMLLATHLDLAKKVAAAPTAQTPLNAKLVELKYKKQQFVLAGSRDALPQKMIDEMKREVDREELPPAFDGITDVLSDVQQVSAVANLDPLFSLKLGVETSNKETTEKLLTMTKDGLTLAKTSIGFFLIAPPQGMPPSFRPVIQQFLKVLAKIELKQDGKQLDAAVSVPTEMATTVQTAISEVFDQGRSAARTMSGQNNMKQIGLAIHVFHDRYKAFPIGENEEANIQFQDGKPLLSWRVHLLPYLEQEALYNQFKLDEPWNSEHNARLVNQVPHVYQSPNHDQPNAEGMTTYVAPVGPGSIFGTKKMGFRDVPDGTSYTIMMVDAGPDKAVLWTKPDDLPYDANEIDLGAVGESFMALFSDGSVQQLSSEIDSELLLKLFQRNDGGEIDLDDLNLDDLSEFEELDLGREIPDRESPGDKK